MKTILLAVPLMLGLAACETYPNSPYGQGPYDQGPYKQDPYGPQSYPQPAPYPQPYPAPYPQPYPQPYPAPYPAPYASGTAASALSQTNWRVVSINGRPTPASGYYINVMPDRLSARFGCNSLGAGYTVQGDYLNAGAVMATRMACADMSFETAGANILARPMLVTMVNPERLSLSNAAGSIEAVRVH